MHRQVASDWCGRPVFEQLEPRLLLSADFSSVALPEVLSAADSVPVVAEPLEAPASWSADYDAGGPKGDAYEENDTLATAYDLSAHEQTWLSSISGPGVQVDDDWYEIYVTPGEENLIVDLTFSHAAGDIDLEVYDSGGGLVTGSYSITDDEHIDTILPSSGTYYLLVYFGDAGNDYDLWWDDVQPQVQDDAYEENDTQATAYDLSAHEQTWLSSINGAGVQADDDWYQIYITPGFENLVVDLTFTDADGDIDLELYDSGGGLVTGSHSITDDEHIDTILTSPGTYYLKVFYENAGNTYDLWWDAVQPQVQDDAYEENDTRVTAYDLSAHEQTWLSSINGPGVQADDDWYEIDVTAGHENLVVDLTFSHAAGDINLEVYDWGGGLVTGSYSTTDGEHIDTIVPSSGTYYLLVYLGNAGNNYDLWWDDVQPPVQDDAYEENDTQATAYDLSADEQTWLSAISGPGVQADDDWYEIYVTPGYENLLVDLTFSHAAGDIDLEVYDSGGVLVTGSYSITDDEHIDTILTGPGTYYLLVYLGDAGNDYDLWWDAVQTQVQDDAYEENDARALAYNLSDYEQTWLSAIDGLGVQADEDWYEIYVPASQENLVVDLIFSHAAGDIDLELHDVGGLAMGSYSTTDNEYIDVILPSPGRYYLRVFYGNAGNTYDLRWDAGSPQGQDDAYEQNDTQATAYDLSAYEQTWLSAISGPGVQADDDWYEIYVSPGHENLLVDLTFSHAAGDIDLEVYNSGGGLVADSYSTTDNEHIDTILPGPGAYYLLVYFGNAGNTYDLWWDAGGLLPGPGDGVVTHRALLADSYGLNDDVYGMEGALLGSTDGAWIGNITLLEYADATVDNVRSGIYDLVSASDQDDLVLIYFTSHGSQAGSDSIPVDEPDADDGEVVMIDGSILDDELGSWCSVFAAGPYPMDRFVLIVDICYAGEVLDGTADPAGTVPSHVIISSSQVDELSYGGTPYSEFTGSFVEALTTHVASADLNADGYVSAEEAFTWADDRVVDQDPEISDTFPGDLNLVRYTHEDAYEPDDTGDQANQIATDGTPQTHSIHTPSDVDWVTFTLNDTSNVTIETAGISGDTQMWLYGPNNWTTLIEYDDDAGEGLFSRIERTLDAGTYYVQVDEYGNNSTIDSYTISVSAVNIDTVPPNDPTSLVMTARTDQTIELSWTAPTQAPDGDYAVSYIVERNGVPVGWPVGPTFTDTGLTQATPYFYEVYAVDDADNPSLGAAAGTFATTYPGDANTDDCVDGLDYVIWSNNYGMPGGWPEANFNGDGIVDGLDYVIWSNNYGNGCPPGVPSALTESGEKQAGGELQATAALPASAALPETDMFVGLLHRAEAAMPPAERVGGAPTAADWVAPAVLRGLARPAESARDPEPALLAPKATAAQHSAGPGLATLEDSLVDILGLAQLAYPLQA